MNGKFVRTWKKWSWNHHGIFGIYMEKTRKPTKNIVKRASNPEKIQTRYPVNTRLLHQAGVFHITLTRSIQLSVIPVQCPT